MKHNISIKAGWLVSAVLFITSCSDSFLERDPHGVLDENTYYTTDDAGMKMVTNCYVPLRDGFAYSINKIAIGSESVDDADCGGSDPGDRPQTAEIGRGRPLASNPLLLETWQHRYKGIGRCNAAIEGLSKEGLQLVSGGQPVPQATISRYIAEVKFLRAWYYFDLVNTFAGVPLVISTLPPSERPPRSTLEEVRTQLYKDLDEAIADANLPSASQLPASETGRASKEAAKTLKARAAMFFAGLMNQGKMQGDVIAEYAIAKQLSGDIISGSNLSLLPDFQDLYKGDYITGQQSKESIFTVETDYKPEIGMGGDAFAIMNVGRNNVGGWGGCCPTRDLTAAFEVNDPRKVFTAISDGDIFPTAAGGEEVHNYRGYNNDYNLQHSRKAFVPQAYRLNGDLMRSKWAPYWMRYSEVLLIYAEANLQSGGNKTETVKYLNQVRHRAFVTTSKTDESAIYRKLADGLTPVDDATFTSQYAVKESDDLLKAIKHERRVEFALEGLRLYDLVRWGDYTSVMQAFYKKYGFADKGINAGDNSWPFPIPQAEIDRSNGALEQNPNY